MRRPGTRLRAIGWLLRLRLRLRPWGVGIHVVGVVRGVVLWGLLGWRVLLHGGVLVVGEWTLWRHVKTVAVLSCCTMLLLHR